MIGREKRRQIVNKIARAFTASLSGRGIFTMGLILFVVLGSIGLGVGTVAGASIEVKVTQIDVGPDGVWITSNVTVPVGADPVAELYISVNDTWAEPVCTVSINQTTFRAYSEVTMSKVKKVIMPICENHGNRSYSTYTYKFFLAPAPGTHYCRVAGQYAKASGESAREMSEVKVFLVPTETLETPGFEAVFAIAGLLAVAYLVRRRKK